MECETAMSVIVRKMSEAGVPTSDLVAYIAKGEEATLEEADRLIAEARRKAAAN